MEPAATRPSNQTEPNYPARRKALFTQLVEPKKICLSIHGGLLFFNVFQWLF